MTKTNKTALSDTELDLTFQAARAAAPIPSDALMMRIMDGADTVSALAHAPAPTTQHPGLWTKVVAALGGWPAVAGMATATVAGVWIGFATPDTLDSLSGGVLSVGTQATVNYDLEDLVPGFDRYPDMPVEG